MSRIREALTKIEGGSRPAPAPVTPVASPYATARALEPRRYTPPALSPVYAEPEPMQEAPYVPEITPSETVPGIPGDFHGELSALRFTLETALPGRTTRVVQFAAAVAGEGTTSVAANFARVIAQDATQNVLLVDANVRRPGLGLFFATPERAATSSKVTPSTPLARRRSTVASSAACLASWLRGRAIASRS